MTRLLFAVSVLAAALAPPAVSAQTAPSVYAVIPAPASCRDNCAGTLVRATLDPPAVVSSAVLPLAVSLLDLQASADGRFLIWREYLSAGNSQGLALVLHDLVTGGTTTVPLPAGSSGIVGSPTRTEIYLSDRDGPMMLSAAGARRFTAPACAFAEPTGTSGDGRRVVYFCFDPFVGFSFVIDIASGAVVGTIPSRQAALNADGTVAYAADRLVSSWVLRSIDVATGATIASAPIAFDDFFTDNIRSIRVDHRANTLVLTGERALHLADATTLEQRLWMAYWFASYGGLTAASLDVDRSRLYATSYQIVEPGDRYYAASVVDTAARRVAPLPAIPNAVIIGVPLPAPPVAAAPVVTGSHVQLAWAPGALRGAPRGYVLEVGSAPGLSNIFAGLDVGLQTSFSASSVPPGRYYVRVRATNYTGRSTPSNEVVVVVP